MDAWRLRIVADTDAEAAASAQDIVATPELSVQTSWIAAKLDELQDALQRGEIDRERYEHEHNEWLEDEAEDQRLQAEGWAYDEEQGDYWHPAHGWGEEYDPEESTDALSALPDSTANADETPPFTETHSLLSDFPPVHDLAADIDQPLPSPHITLDLDEPTHADFVVDKPVYIVLLPPAHVNAPPSSLFSPLRSAHPKRTTARFARPRTMYTLRDPPHPLKHPTNRPREYRSSSARPAAKNRRRAVRHTHSCPDLQREPPPHLSTSSVPAADPDKPPDTPIAKAIRPAVARDTADDITVPAEPVPPDISPSTPPNTLSATKSDARPPRSARAPPIASVHAMALPIPPDIPHTRPSAALSAERRRNAQRRLAKKGKS
ncbi:hypothetical protein B0H19DRAFT_1349445 [Mycena capillaripes]|nr:hypothetical protein B0H19DRAFT_1349445 [Mycena capillaripes]